MHYSKHRLTASVAHVTTLTYATNRLALLARWSVNFRQKTKPCQFRLVQFSYVALYAPLGYTTYCKSHIGFSL